MKFSYKPLIALILFLIILFIQDVEAFFIATVLTPIFWILFKLAVRIQNLVLQSFCFLMFVAHGIGAPFAWLDRDIYNRDIWANFQFKLGELFYIYFWVVIIYALIIFFTLMFENIKFLAKSSNLKLLKIRKRGSNSNLYSYLIVSLIIFMMVPLNIYMSTNKIGILGLLSEDLPYRMTGILYYFRLYIFPFVILFLYAKSNRGFFLFLIIFSYAILAGLSSASRSVLIINLFPVIFYTLIDKRKLRILVTMLFSILGYMLITSSRDYTHHTSDVFILSEALYYASTYILDGKFSAYDLVGGFSNRLFGMQDFIVSYSFISDQPWTATFNYFLEGGRADTVVPNLERDLFGITNLEGTGFGIGVGTMAYFLILAHSNFLTTPCIAIVLGLMMFVGNRLLGYALCRAVIRSYFSLDFAMGCRIALGFLMALFLYSSSLNLFYNLLTMVLIFILVSSFLSKIRTS